MIYVTGASNNNSSGSDIDFATVAITANGTQQWVSRHGGTAGFVDRGIKLFATDTRVYVTGISNNTGIGSFEDIATLQYDVSGNLLWSAVYNGPMNLLDAPSDLTVDSAGNVYITGTATVENSANGPNSGRDFITLKYNASGIRQWAETYDAAHRHDLATALALDAAGNVYVTGSSMGAATNFDITTIKYSQPVPNTPGSTCANAIDLGQMDTCVNNLNVSSEIWFRFIASENNIRLYFPMQSNFSAVIRLYSGPDCSSLNLIETDSIAHSIDNMDSYEKKGLIIGNVYWVRLSVISLMGNLNLCIDQFLQLICPPLPPCNYIYNGSLEAATLPTYTGQLTNASCWYLGPTGGTCGGSSSTGGNTPDLFAGPTTTFVGNCTDGNSNIGVPANFDSPNTSAASGGNYMGLFRGEKVSVDVAPLTNSVYVLQFSSNTGDITSCGYLTDVCLDLTTPSGSPSFNICSSCGLGLGSSWTQETFCVDLQNDPNPSIYTRLAIKGGSGTSNPVRPESLFDDFSLVKLSDAGPDKTYCSCSSTTIGPLQCIVAGATYAWSPSTGLSCTNCPNPTVSVTNCTTVPQQYIYTLTVTDPSGNCFATDQVTVTVNPNICSIQSPYVICAGQNVAIGNYNCPTVPGSTFSWSPATGLSNPNIANPIATPPNTITYNVTVTNPFGCVFTGQVTVFVNPGPTVNAGTDQNICLGSSNVVTLGGSPTASGGSGSYTYSWSPASGLSCSNCPNPTIIFNSPVGTYPYTVTVTDANGCSSTDQVIVNIVSLPQFSITGPASTCTLPATYCAAPFPAGSTVAWNVPSGIIYSSSGNCITVSSWGPFSNTGALICATVTDINGCSSQQCINVSGCCVPANLPPGTIQLTDATINTTTGYFNQTFLINGTLTIDNGATVTFQTCDLIMGPNALIEIKSNSTLFLFSICGVNPDRPTHLFAGCNYMWRGIHIQPGSQLLSIGASSVQNSGGLMIEDADSAIVSFGGGNFTIEGTWFNKNHKSIVVAPYLSTHSGTIKNSVFTCRTLPAQCLSLNKNNFANNFSTTTLLPPHASERSYIGIDVDRAVFQVGDPAQNINLNVFDNLDFGVFGSGSRITVYNNRFQNITTTTFFPINGMGVYLSGGHFIPPVPAMGIIVGGNGLPSNDFINCGVGVRVLNTIPSIVVNYNKFTNNFISAAWVSSCFGSTINIRSNNILNNPGKVLLGAILCTDITGSNAIINNNIINQQSVSTSATTATFGISVQNVNPSGMNLLIANNTIWRQRTGIWLVGVTENSQPTVDNNTINITPLLSSFTASSIHYGIRLQGCMDVHVRNNAISRTGAPSTAAIALNLQGINIENSPQSIIGKGNILTKMGSGIYCDGSDNNSTLACNDLVRCWHGIFFNSANVGNQLPNGVAQQNEWINPASSPVSKMAGSISPAIDWWWMGGATFSPTPHTVFPGFNVGQPAVTTDPTDICASLIIEPPSPQQARAPMFEATVQNQLSFTDKQAERTAWSKQYAHRFFKDNPGWLNLSLPDDSVFQNFYNMENQGNAGRFEMVNDFMAQRDAQNADAANAAVIPTNTIENNRQAVNKIYINSWLQGIQSFSSSDSSYLLNIALQDPIDGGNAVYSARVMMDIDPVILGQRMNETELFAGEVETREIKIYPNPAENKAILDFILNENEMGYMEITSVMGQTMALYTMKPHQILTFDLYSIPTGVYFYTVKVNDEIIHTNKLVILK